MLIAQRKRLDLIYIFGLIAIGSLLTVPAIFGGIFEAHDLIRFHLKWSKYFSEQFWLGELYPRWLVGMNAGLGSPAFFFYGPVPYYFTSLLHPLFSGDPYGWHQLGSSAAFALVASGITAYIWLKNITNPNAAFIASILYMVLPYHLGIDFYTRFAFAEHWTFVWIPLILYFTKRIIEGHKFATVGFSISYALLIMTHLITVLIFSIIPVLYVLLMAAKQEKRKVASVILAMILGIGLSAIYLLPAMTTQGYISIQAIMQGKYFYGNNFLFSGSDFYRSKFDVYLGFMTLLMGGLASCAFVVARANSKVNTRRESVYWFAIAAAALLMTLPFSKPVWEIFSVLQRVQHPWRFNTILTVATTALLALGISLKQPITLSTKRQLTLGGLILIVLVSSGAMVAHIYTTPKLLYSYTRLEKPLSVDTELKLSLDALEYRPKWVPPEIFESTNMSKLGERLPKAQIAAGTGSLSVEKWEPKQIVLQTDATTDIWLILHQFYYPRWTAKLINTSTYLPIQPSKPEGLLSVKVPSGKQKVVVNIEAGLEERTGQFISAISAITLFLVFWFGRFGRANNSLRLSEKIQ